MSKNSRNNYLLKRFGITEDQYDELLRKQDGCCAVCKRPADSFKTRLAVDHDHASMAIRGLLCFKCNKYVVGRHRRDAGASLLKQAYEYLVADYPGWLVPPKVKKKRRAKKRIKRNMVSKSNLRRSRNEVSSHPNESYIRDSV